MTPPSSTRSSLLFVCLGNICRSPLAEGVFLHLASERQVGDRFHVDSCGTGGWHVGEPPDTRAQAVASRNGVGLPSRARRLDAPGDFDRFDLIVPMDRANLRDLLAEGAPPDRTRLLRSWDPALSGATIDELDVPDPYYGGADGFTDVFQMVRAACDGLLDDLLAGV